MTEEATEEGEIPVQQQMLSFVCEYCSAPAGQWCLTKSGNRASYLHGARWWAWKNRQAEQHAKSLTEGT
jgi:hypothetical protein